MSETFPPQMYKHLWTLQCYMHALDAGDLATLEAVLKKAEHDPTLERLLLETNEIYLADDQLAVSQEDLISALTAIGEVIGTDQAETHASTFSHRRERVHLLREHTAEEEEKEKIMDDPTSFVSTLASQPISKQQSKRRFLRTGLQMAAAILTVCVLIGGFLLVFASHRNLSTLVGSQPAHPTPPDLLITSSIDLTNTRSIEGRRADNGTLVWNYPLPQGNQQIQITTQNQIVYATTNGQVYALAAQTGVLIWHTDLHLAQSGTMDGNTGSITYDQGMIYLTYGALSGNAQDAQLDTQLYALNAQHGTLTWHHAIGDNLAFTASNGMVYVGISSPTPYGTGSVIALRGSDGHQLWSYPIPDVISLLVANQALYIQSAAQPTPSDQGGNKQDKPLIALNATSGNLLWSITVEDDGPDQLVSGDGLVVLYRTTATNGRFESQFCAYARSNGHQVWCTSSYQGPGDQDTANYLIVNQTLFATYAKPSTNASTGISTYTEYAEAINLSNGSILWTQSIPATNFPSPLNSVTLHGVLYFAGFDMVAVRAESGQLLWHVKSGKGWFGSLHTNG